MKDLVLCIMVSVLTTLFFCTIFLWKEIKIMWRMHKGEDVEKCMKDYLGKEGE